MKKYAVLVSAIIALMSSGFVFAAPYLYFTDAAGTPISEMTATPGEDISVYIYGQTDTGNPYDSWSSF